MSVQQTDKESHQHKLRDSTEEFPVSVSASLDLHPAQENDVSSPCPAVEINSIFTGLQLSNKVTLDEAPDSPYMKGGAGKVESSNRNSEQTFYLLYIDICCRRPRNFSIAIFFPPQL